MTDNIRIYRLPVGVEPVAPDRHWPTIDQPTSPRHGEPRMIPQASGCSHAQYSSVDLYDDAGRVIGYETRSLSRYLSGAEQWFVRRYYRYDDAPADAIDTETAMIADLPATMHTTY